jgi:hypothetical protein
MLDQQIVLFVQEQFDGTSPDHWTLGVGPKNGAVTLIQVKGDPYPGMYYSISKNPGTVFQSKALKKSIYLGSVKPSDIANIAAIAESVPPPVAKSQAEVHENCQHWTATVIQKLEAIGYVKAGKYADVSKKVDTWWRDDES